MSMPARTTQIDARPRARHLALVAVLGVLLAACGGDGNGGGNGGTGHTLHTLMINASEADVTVGYVGDGEAAEDQVLATCTAELFDYPLADPFQILIDGEVVLDTFEDLPDGLPNLGETDLILQVKVERDGSVTPGEVKPGRGNTKPSSSAFCPTLPG